MCVGAARSGALFDLPRCSICRFVGGGIWLHESGSGAFHPIGRGCCAPANRREINRTPTPRLHRRSKTWIEQLGKPVSAARGVPARVQHPRLASRRTANIDDAACPDFRARPRGQTSPRYVAPIGSETRCCARQACAAPPGILRCLAHHVPSRRAHQMLRLPAGCSSLPCTAPKSGRDMHTVFKASL